MKDPDHDSANWWDLEVIDEPYPHIPEQKILEAMPKDLHQQWERFIDGQTCLAKQGENGKWASGIYPWDLDRFISIINRK
jgi:hypothetical protein